MIPTPHIEVKDKGIISETVLLPGDPLRARCIADKYLENAVQINSIRNMSGYAGTFNGKRVTVMGTGMGMPSMGIYSYELIHFYGVKNLIRIGSAGSLQADVKVRDIVIAMSASTNSNYSSQFQLPGTYAPTASWMLLQKAVAAAEKKGVDVKIGNIVSTDVFYNDSGDAWKKWAMMGTLAIEMEAAALYMNAARAGVNALCILTVSDSLVTNEATTSEERQNSFTQMMEIALELV